MSAVSMVSNCVCGSTPECKESKYKRDAVHRIKCDKCGAFTDWMRRYMDAIGEWNDWVKRETQNRKFKRRVQTACGKGE